MKQVETIDVDDHPSHTRPSTPASFLLADNPMVRLLRLAADCGVLSNGRWVDNSQPKGKVLVYPPAAESVGLTAPSGAVLRVGAS